MGQMKQLGIGSNRMLESVSTELMSSSNDRASPWPHGLPRAAASCNGCDDAIENASKLQYLQQKKKEADAFAVNSAYGT